MAAPLMRERDSLEAALASRHRESLQGMKKLPLSMTLILAWESLGIVYGDIGTSPLYVYSSTFSNLSQGLSDQRDLIGVLSLILWTLTLSPVVKYCLVVLLCDDNGEGGTCAVYSLLCRHVKMSRIGHAHEDLNLSQYTLVEKQKERGEAVALKRFLEENSWVQLVILGIVLMATCFLIGDGALTPAQSVLSAIGGIKVNAPNLSQDVIVGISCAILAALFLAQFWGTAKIGFTFAPIVMVWLITIAVVGIWNLARYNAWYVCKAFSPHYGIDFLVRNGKDGWICLGGVFLAITGTEAMFADLGHFSARAVQIGFIGVTYPCLMVAYIGQAAWLTQPENALNVGTTFYSSIPQTPGLYWPIFVLATAAAMVASQAIISATFSIVSQSMALGCFPRCKIIHTSTKFKGQIYMPEMNFILGVITILIAATMGSQGTTTIGNAYGVAVSGTMVITTFLVTLALICVKHWPVWLWLPFFGFFFAFDAVYLSSNLYKTINYGWVPLAIAGGFLTVMGVWRYGTLKILEHEQENKLSLDWLTSTLTSNKIARIPGVGVFHSELISGVPPIFSHFIASVPSVHEIVLFLAVKHIEVPCVLPEERFLFRRVGPLHHRMFRCVVRFGYNDGNTKDSPTLDDQLIEALTLFIRMEDPRDWAGKKLEVTNGYQKGEEGVNGEGNGALEFDAPEVQVMKQEELEVLSNAKDSALIHILGHVTMRTKSDAFILKKVVIDYGYYILQQVSRRMDESLNIPIQNLLEVGMQYEV